MNVYDAADLVRLLWSRSWRWLLWSPRRLGAVVAVVVAIVVGWTQVTGSGPGLSADDTDAAYHSDDLPAGWQDWQVVTADPESDDPADPAPTTAPTTSEPTTEPSETDHGHDSGGGGKPAHKAPSKKTKAKATAAAVAFAKAYVHRERPPKKWYSKVAPHTVKSLRKPLKTVNPKNVTAKKITGKAKIDSIGDMGGRIIVPTNAGRLVLGVTNTGSRWAVSKVIPPSRPSSPR